MALFNKNDKDDRESLFRQALHGASYSDAKAGVTAKNLILGILATLGILAVVIFGAAEIISSIVVSLTEQHQKICEHGVGYDVSTMYIRENEKAAYAKCNDCGKPLKIEATVTVVDVQEPTCTADGIVTEQWTFEGLRDVVHDVLYTIPKVDHEIGKVIFDGQSATCKLEGVTPEGYCINCGKRVGGDPIPKTECDYVRYGYVEATCFSDGMTGYEKCSFCNAVRGENTVVPALTHKCTEGSFEATYECSAFIGKKCELCNTPVEITEITGEPGVNEFFEYEIVSEEYIRITAVKKATNHPVIPDRIDGLPVIYLADGLFEGADIQSITLSENLVELGARVFKDCEQLEEVKIPRSVEAVGEECFAGCTSLRSIATESASIGAYAFAGCYRLREITLGEGVDFIDSYAFGGALNLLFLRIEAHPDSITIASNAFDGVTEVYTLHVTEGLNLGLEYTYKYDAQKVSADLKGYRVEEGAYIALDTEQKTLIALDAFGNVAKVPGGVEVIAEGALTRSSWIDTVVIPSSVKTVEKSYREDVVNILYEGDEDEWSYVEYKGINNYDPNGQNSYPIFAEIYFYSEGNPAGGPYWHYTGAGEPEIWI